MIKPTIGRIVWFYPEAHQPGEQPQAGIIAHVHDDSHIAIATFDQWGNTFPQSSVRLLAEGEPTPESAYATWMPYQLGQAKAVTAAEDAAKGEGIDDQADRINSTDTSETEDLVRQRDEDLPPDDED